MAALSTLALLAASAVKTGLEYSSQRQAAKIAETQGNETASLFRTNAGLADSQAADAIDRGNQAAGGIDRQTRLLGGSQRAALAAQGVDVSTGSARDVVGNDQALGALDALTIRNNAAREAWGFQTQAGSYRQQAGFAQAGGANQASALRRESLGTLLGGAAELYNVWDSAPKGVGRSITSSAPAPRIASPSWVPKSSPMQPSGWNG